MRRALSCAIACCTLYVAGCVTTDLAAGDGAATLDLYLMASSQRTTRCVIRAIDGTDVSDKQSAVLTAKYLVPSGLHTYTMLCEDLVGSIPVTTYRFELRALLEEGGDYVLLQRARVGAAACIGITAADSKSGDEPVAEFCPSGDSAGSDVTG